MITSMWICSCETMTAALYHSLEIQLCRPSKLDCANQRCCSCSTIYNACLMKPKVKEENCLTFLMWCTNSTFNYSKQKSYISHINLIQIVSMPDKLIFDYKQKSTTLSMAENNIARWKSTLTI